MRDERGRDVGMPWVEVRDTCYTPCQAQDGPSRKWPRASDWNLSHFAKGFKVLMSGDQRVGGAWGPCTVSTSFTMGN